MIAISWSTKKSTKSNYLGLFCLFIAWQQGRISVKSLSLVDFFK